MAYQVLYSSNNMTNVRPSLDNVMPILGNIISSFYKNDDHTPSIIQPLEIMTSTLGKACIRYNGLTFLEEVFRDSSWHELPHTLLHTIKYLQWPNTVSAYIHSTKANCSKFTLNHNFNKLCSYSEKISWLASHNTGINNYLTRFSCCFAEAQAPFLTFCSNLISV